MIRIDLLRHGLTGASGAAGYYHGRTDLPLTSVGWSQMQAAVAVPEWHSVRSSSLRRCAEFARAYCGWHGLPLTVEDDWREIDFGDWEGLSVAQLHEEQPEALAAFWNDPVNCGPPGSEALEAMRARVLAACGRLLDEASGPTLVVTHGGPIRLLVAEANGWPLARLMEVEALHAGRVRLWLGRAEDGGLRVSAEPLA